jgi:cytochrome P450 family 144
MTVAEPLFDPQVVEEPYAYYRALRETDPVHAIDGTGTWLVTSSSLIQEVVARPEIFSSSTNHFLFVDPDGAPALRDIVGEELADVDGLALLATADPPDHGRQRKVLSRLLSTSSVARLEPEMRALVDAALEPHLAAGQVEWMYEVAEPLPAQMLARILGLPDDTAPFLKDLGYASVEQISGFATEARCHEIRERLFDLGPVGEAYGQARLGEGPGPDTVIGACAHAVTAGGLNEIEALGMLVLIISAGSESTTSLLGTGARILAQDEKLQQRLREEPMLIATFVEEACRIDPPFRGHYRRATRDTVLGGVNIPADARLLLAWPAANRDDEAYCHPDGIDLDRASPRQHLGFGWGIHLCLGAPLARLEARVAFEQLLNRTTSFTAGADDLKHHASLTIRRLVELPLRFGP